jgi:hypothetical protein
MKRNYLSAWFFAFTALLLFPLDAFAQQGAEDIAQNITNSTTAMPALLSGFMYLTGIVLVITGLIKLKEHVDNERQTPLRTPVIRLIVAGMCFALPLIFDVIRRTVLGTGDNVFNESVGLMGQLNGFLAGLTAFAALGNNFNTILFNIHAFSDRIPGIISALAYLLAILLTASGILKLKEHVEEPEKTTIKEPIVRFLTAGALFALPGIYEVVYTTVAGTGVGFFGGAVAILNTVNFLVASYAEGIVPDCTLAAFGLGQSFGDVICMAMLNSIGLPAFLTAISYVLGLIFGLWGIVKIRDHVLNPAQTRLNEGVTRLLAAGAFFGMPVIATALQSSFMPVPLAGLALDGTTGYNGVLACGVFNSLDQALGCFVDDILEPGQTVLNFFCFVAGLIFVMIGISRLVKSAQDGPRGPGGLGTVATFVTGGILMSGTSLLAALSGSLFGDTETATRGTLLFAAGMTAAETNAALNVVSAVIKFMIIIGLVSFVRGIFILRDSAEGKGQASVMSGITHIIGGALAVNLGPLINAIQWTLGITAFGVTFI